MAAHPIREEHTEYHSAGFIAAGIRNRIVFICVMHVAVFTAISMPKKQKPFFYK